MSLNCWRLEIAAFSSSGGCSSSCENGCKTPRVFPSLSESREAAGRGSFLSVGANVGPIWVALRLGQTVPDSRAGASSMAQHNGWWSAAAGGRWASGEPAGSLCGVAQCSAG